MTIFGLAAEGVQPGYVYSSIHENTVKPAPKPVIAKENVVIKIKLGVVIVRVEPDTIFQWRMRILARHIRRLIVSSIALRRRCVFEICAVIPQL